MTVSNLVGQLRNRSTSYLVRWWAAWKVDWLKPEPFDWRALIVIVAGAFILLPLTSRLPMVGWEWPLHVGGAFNDTYPPWLQFAIKPFTIWHWRTGLSLLYGGFMIAVAILTLKAASGQTLISKFSAAVLALCTPLVPMLLWEGNLAMVVMIGMAILPFGIPWALVQPHLAAFGLLARRKWTIWALVFGLITLLIWGLWPLQTFGLLGKSTGHPIALGWIAMGWPTLVIGLLMLPFTNANPRRLMAVGTFLLPYVMAVHMILLVPAVGEVKGWRRLLLFGLAWFTLITPALYVVWAKYLTMLFPFAVWWLLRPRKNDGAADEGIAASQI